MMPMFMTDDSVMSHDLQYSASCRASLEMGRRPEVLVLVACRCACSRNTAAPRTVFETGTGRHRALPIASTLMQQPATTLRFAAPNPQRARPA